jgi:hypothetical protein
MEEQQDAFYKARLFKSLLMISFPIHEECPEHRRKTLSLLPRA